MARHRPKVVAVQLGLFPGCDTPMKVTPGGWLMPITEADRTTTRPSRRATQPRQGPAAYTFEAMMARRTRKPQEEE